VSPPVKQTTLEHLYRCISVKHKETSLCRTVEHRGPEAESFHHCCSRRVLQPQDPIIIRLTKRVTKRPGPVRKWFSSDRQRRDVVAQIPHLQKTLREGSLPGRPTSNNSDWTVNYCTMKTPYLCIASTVHNCIILSVLWHSRFNTVGWPEGHQAKV